MQLLSLNALITPLVTGTVGYVTNWLAIKMLFRPYRRRWYSFGWQGVIPRTRPMLAQKVGAVVGDKLLGQDELLSILSGEPFQKWLHGFFHTELERFLSKDRGTLTDIAVRFQIKPDDMIGRFLADIAETKGDTLELISRTLADAVKQAADTLTVGDLNAVAAPLRSQLKDTISKMNFAGVAGKAIAGQMFALAFSGATVGSILPQGVLALKAPAAQFIAKSGVEMLAETIKRPEVLNVIAQKLIDVKNAQFKGEGFLGQLQAGFVNVMLFDDNIREIVQKEMPKVADELAANPAVHEAAAQKAAEKIDAVLNKSIASLAMSGGGAAGGIMNAVTEVLSSPKVSSMVADGVDSALVGFLADHADTPLSTLAAPLIDQVLSASSIRQMLANEALREKAAKTIASSLGSLNPARIYSDIPASVRTGMQGAIANSLNAMIVHALPSFIGQVNLAGIVEKKINSLDLAEVEDLLFSFMQDHFRWINILGFVLGALFGVAQVAAFALFG